MQAAIDLTIIVPFYNQYPYIGECLQSISSQSLASLEVICIDDASDDGSREVARDCASEDARFTLLTNSRNLGPGESRNLGIDAARGRFLRFVDSDDLLPPPSSESLLQRAREKNSDLVKGVLAQFQEANWREPFAFTFAADRDHVDFKIEEALWVPWWHQSFLVSTDLVRRNALRYPNLRRGEDPPFLASVLVNASKISLIDEVVYLYRRYKKTDGSAQVDFPSLVDSLIHAQMVKDIYLAAHPDAWNKGYGPYLLEDVQRYVKRAQLTEVEKNQVSQLIRDVWPSSQTRW